MTPFSFNSLLFFDHHVSSSGKTTLGCIHLCLGSLHTAARQIHPNANIKIIMTIQNLSIHITVSWPLFFNNMGRLVLRTSILSKNDIIQQHPQLKLKIVVKVKHQSQSPDDNGDVSVNPNWNSIWVEMRIINWVDLEYVWGRKLNQSKLDLREEMNWNKIREMRIVDLIEKE